MSVASVYEAACRVDLGDVRPPCTPERNQLAGRFLGSVVWALCKRMAPQFQQAARLLEPKVWLTKFNAEAETQLAAQFVIRSILTLAPFRDEREIARQTGAMGHRTTCVGCPRN